MSNYNQFNPGVNPSSTSQYPVYNLNNNPNSMFNGMPVQAVQPPTINPVYNPGQTHPSPNFVYNPMFTPSSLFNLPPLPPLNSPQQPVLNIDDKCREFDQIVKSLTQRVVQLENAQQALRPQPTSSSSSTTTTTATTPASQQNLPPQREMTQKEISEAFHGPSPKSNITYGQLFRIWAASVIKVSEFITGHKPIQEKNLLQKVNDYVNELFEDKNSLYKLQMVYCFNDRGYYHRYHNQLTIKFNAIKQWLMTGSCEGYGDDGKLYVTATKLSKLDVLTNPYTNVAGKLFTYYRTFLYKLLVLVKSKLSFFEWFLMMDVRYLAGLLIQVNEVGQKLKLAYAVASEEEKNKLKETIRELKTIFEKGPITIKIYPTQEENQLIMDGFEQKIKPMLDYIPLGDDAPTSTASTAPLTTTTTITTTTTQSSDAPVSNNEEADMGIDTQVVEKRGTKRKHEEEYAYTSNGTQYLKEGGEESDEEKTVDLEEQDAESFLMEFSQTADSSSEPAAKKPKITDKN